MELTPEIEARIEAVVSTAVEKSLKSGCLCGLGKDAQNEMTHVLGVLKDAGEGSYSVGAERLRATLSFFKKLDTMSTWVARAVIVLIALSCVKMLFGWAHDGALKAMAEALKRIVP